ncbi:MAG TPA: type I-U CRISPR-associated protein Csb2 [Micromonosporaceae bacterium]|nr:type I-U CRISPR-associated protein Csb2 [Micromonosporaceae bacterium]
MWPPAPWRLLRAFVSVWYERWPDLPSADLDAVLAALGDPPAYRTPPVAASHTRHYLPDTNHSRREAGNTALTLDPYLSLPRDQDLLVQWPVDLTAGQRATLAKLAELLPYLGRADAICHARLLDTNPPVDVAWWRPAKAWVGDDDPAVRLLAPVSPVRRPALEVTTTQMRRSRRTLPPATRWVTYLEPDPQPIPSRQLAEPRTVEALRFAVTSRAPFRAEQAVLLADALHHAVAKRLPDDAPDADLVLGRRGATTHHQHSHWIPLPDRAGTVTALIVWVPAQLTTPEVTAILDAALQPLSGRRFRENGIRGFPEARLLLQAAGPIATVAPELCGPARGWRSLSPYLPVRHRGRRETLDGYIGADVARELAYRRLPAPARVVRTDPGDALTDAWARRYRRYRLQERMDKARSGLGLRLELDEAVDGPLMLGQLSHFGYGVFVPDASGF